ncbi:uncharacterized protein Dwil_GK26818 [Drosophila willistoni]|nr:uncharacterized protein Dwil_GK26818 [Drosophila willistoni]
MGLRQLPVTNLKVNYALLKRSNGYRPFLYNYTVDICQFFVATKKHLVNHFIYTWFKDYTNFNHSCPYNHDIVLEKFPTISGSYMDLLPMPAGEYAIDSTWYADDKLRMTGKIFFTFK